LCNPSGIVLAVENVILYVLSLYNYFSVREKIQMNLNIIPYYRYSMICICRSKSPYLLPIVSRYECNHRLTQLILIYFWFHNNQRILNMLIRNNHFQHIIIYRCVVYARVLFQFVKKKKKLPKFKDKKLRTKHHHSFQNTSCGQ